MASSTVIFAPQTQTSGSTPIVRRRGSGHGIQYLAGARPEDGLVGGGGVPSWGSSCAGQSLFFRLPMQEIAAA